MAGRWGMAPGHPMVEQWSAFKPYYTLALGTHLSGSYGFQNIGRWAIAQAKTLPQPPVYVLTAPSLKTNRYNVSHDQQATDIDRQAGK